MGNVRFCGCLHLGDNWAAEYRGFKNPDEYHEHLIKSWNSKVHKKDLTYILGDVSMETNEHYHILDKLNGRKKVVLGNHDLGKHIPDLLKHVETVEGLVHYKGFWLSHAPLHPQELTFVRGNIHAHIHEEDVVSTKVKVDYWDKKGVVTSKSTQGYYNVDIHRIGFIPVTLAELEGYNGEIKHFKNNK